MKAHFLLTLLPAISCICVPLSVSADETDEVVIRSVNPTTRGLSDIPEAEICGDILNVSFISAGEYALYIEDSLGPTAWSTPTTSPVSARGCSAWLLKDPAGNMKDISAFINSNF